MATSREISLATAVLFLPTLVVTMLALLVIEAVARGRGVAAGAGGLYLPLVIGEPLLMALGYAIGLGLVRTRLEAGAIGRRWPHLAGGVIALLFLAVVSIFSQGARMSFIVTASILAGVVAALLVTSTSWRRASRTAS